VPNGGDGGAEEVRLHCGHQRPDSFKAIRELIGASQLVGANNPFWSSQVAMATLSEVRIGAAEREKGQW
jgi:hypothetical protein